MKSKFPKTKLATVQEITEKYKEKIDFLDLEMLIAHSLGKTREFVLAHPEHKITNYELRIMNDFLKRRAKGEPIAYILGRKEFYGLDFIVDKNTLVPRPETELIVELAIQESRIKNQESRIVDVGTGSGNIVISIAKNSPAKIKFYATDISSKALAIAKRNAKLHKVDKKIKFMRGDLLKPVLKKCSMFHVPCSMIIVANLPYLSKEIYQSAPIDVKKYEPKSALYSGEAGLAHYKKLLKQVKLLVTSYGLLVTIFLEISPEQKIMLAKIIKSIFPGAKTDFKKDLAGKWRVCKISL